MRCAISERDNPSMRRKTTTSAATRRQTIERRLQTAQHIARNRIAFRSRRFDDGADFIEIGNGFDRHDLFALDAIDKKIMRRAQQKRLGLRGKFFLGRFVHAHVNLLPEVFDLGSVAPVQSQEMHQHAFSSGKISARNQSSTAADE